MLKREKPNKISRSLSRLCCFSGLSKKSNRLEGQLLFSIFVLLKKGRKKQREQLKVIFK